MTDNAKELLALSDSELLKYCRDDASRWAAAFSAVKSAQDWGPNDIDESLMLTWFANAIEQATSYRLSARQQASVEEVARIFRNQLLQLDLECGESVNIHDAIAKLRGDADVGAAIVLVAEVATWAANALLAKYDIFEKVSRP